MAVALICLAQIWNERKCETAVPLLQLLRLMDGGSFPSSLKIPHARTDSQYDALV
jgi:hypothetical protein